MKEKVIETLIVVVVPLLLTGLVSLLAWGGAALRKKFLEDGKLSLMERTTLGLLQLIQASVWHVEKGVKKKTEEVRATEGKSVTDVDKQEWLNIAFTGVKDALGEQGIDTVKEVLGLSTEAAFENFVKGNIEKTVAALPKKASPPSTPGNLP